LQNKERTIESQIAVLRSQIKEFRRTACGPAYQVAGDVCGGKQKHRGIITFTRVKEYEEPPDWMLVVVKNVIG
jgi:hypothetical protein